MQQATGVLDPKGNPSVGMTLPDGIRECPAWEGSRDFKYIG